MRKLFFAAVVLLMVPALRAQQTAPTDAQPPASSQAEPQAAPQPATQNPNAQTQLPADIRPGHPLDPADVDVLTGKRDREMEAARRSAVPVMAGAYGEYGNYGDYFWMNGRLGGTWDIPMLPLSRISDPFFFGFGRGGFGGGFGRGGIRSGR
ncbi:MAG TPA: hypothetical protein VKT71_11280 [Candidatus Acidoferrales bacterium]|nr:hypothetical protein [Candidatus Acidoferrales bacterium]